LTSYEQSENRDTSGNICKGRNALAFIPLKTVIFSTWQMTHRKAKKKMERDTISDAEAGNLPKPSVAAAPAVVGRRYRWRR
jgi:hypothetical protein